jgi:hypothetical protein
MHWAPYNRLGCGACLSISWRGRCLRKRQRWVSAHPAEAAQKAYAAQSFAPSNPAPRPAASSTRPYLVQRPSGVGQRVGAVDLNITSAAEHAGILHAANGCWCTLAQLADWSPVEQDPKVGIGQFWPPNVLQPVKPALTSCGSVRWGWPGGCIDHSLSTALPYLPDTKPQPARFCTRRNSWLLRWEAECSRN